MKLPSLFSRRRRKYVEIAPHEVMLDSHNLPDYDTAQFEGRLEKPISRPTIISIGVVFTIAALIFIFQAMQLQIVHGDEYKQKSDSNLLRPVPIFAGRGVIYDRNGVELAWNAPSKNFTEGTSSDEAVSDRMYATSTGLSHILGYVKYPSKDTNGFYYQEDFEGVSGGEKYFDDLLQGKAGSRLVEVDAKGHILSENIVRPPEPGQNVDLSIDSRVQSALYKNIEDIATRSGFSGGAGVIMDVHTGEIIALTSYPEYSSQVMSDKTDVALVRSELQNQRLPFLNRAIDGLYTPGSIVKPFISLGVLTEHVIDPSTIIYTTGSVSIPNPYDSTKSTIFKDWKNLGALDLRHAIAWSSDAYFYTVGGGYKEQKGLGIANIDKYIGMFGLGTTSSKTSFLLTKSGTIPTPEWKKKTFNESWYLGDTYHTAIGQYGFQVTPVQIVRAIAALSNGGTLLNPTILKGDATTIDHVIDQIPSKNYQIVREGMRLGTMEGTTVILNVPYTHIAAKSGTAELGISKDKVNSWTVGFWPFENPKYAFAVMLEKGPADSRVGTGVAVRQQLDWMNENTPEYFK